MKELKEKIERTLEGMLPELHSRSYLIYSCALVAASILSLVPLLTYVFL